MVYLEIWVGKVLLAAFNEIYAYPDAPSVGVVFPLFAPLSGRAAIVARAIVHVSRQHRRRQHEQHKRHQQRYAEFEILILPHHSTPLTATVLVLKACSGNAGLVEVIDGCKVGAHMPARCTASVSMKAADRENGP